MSTQELIANTEWGPERLYEEKLQKQKDKVSSSQKARNLLHQKEISEKERKEREEKRKQQDLDLIAEEKRRKA